MGRAGPAVLIIGAGNLLLSDEGFGVHFVRHFAARYQVPPGVELLDGGTLGLMLAARIEDADWVYIVDVVDAVGLPGEIVRFEKPQFMIDRLPIKLSPHQAGLQETLLVSELRGRCPERISLLGIIPDRLQPGTELSPALAPRLPKLAADLVEELRQLGFKIQPVSSA